MEADAFERFQKKESAMFPDDNVDLTTGADSGSKGLYVTPCCRKRVGVNDCEPLQQTGVCPACGAHVCGRRLAGLPTCVACNAQ